MASSGHLLASLLRLSFWAARRFPGADIRTKYTSLRLLARGAAISLTAAERDLALCGLKHRGSASLKLELN